MSIRLIRVGGLTIWSRASGVTMPKTVDIELVQDGLFEVFGAEQLQQELSFERAMKEGCQAHLLEIAACLDQLGIDVQEDEPTSARAIRALREMQAALEVAQLLVGQTPTKE